LELCANFDFYIKFSAQLLAIHLRSLRTFGVLLGMFIASPSIGEVKTSKVEIPVVGSKRNERVKEVSSVLGVLRFPSKATGQVLAVFLLHSDTGIFGAGDFYARALNSAGTATLEVDSYRPRGVRSGSDRNAPVLCDRLQDAWGALFFSYQRFQDQPTTD